MHVNTLIEIGREKSVDIEGGYEYKIDDAPHNHCRFLAAASRRHSCPPDFMLQCQESWQMKHLHNDAQIE